MTPQVSSAQRKKDPSTPSSHHLLMADRIDIANTLMAGTDAIRQAGTRYLPRYEAESNERYNERLNRSVLTNYFRRTALSLVGKPFSSPIILSDDMPQQLKDISEDIDRQGNSIDVFGRKMFLDALVKGLTHFLVEFPETTGAATLEEERALGNAPYFVHVPAESVIAAYNSYEKGQEVLTHVRIYEMETVQDGFDEYTVERIRILEPGTWYLMRKEKNKWIKEREGVTTLDYIPMVTFYTEREDFMVGRSPLLDLAHVNIAHYQSSSDQRNVLTVARFPMLAGTGINDEESQIRVGPRQVLASVSKDAKFYYVEHTGAAIEAGHKDLEDLRTEMSVLGLELLKKSGDATATAKAIDTAENLSMLQALALLFTDALEQGYRMMADWLKMDRENVGTVKINTDFGLSLNETSDLQQLQWARQNGEISHEAYIRELQRRAVLSDDYNLEDDKTKLEEEKISALADIAANQALVADGTIPPPKPPEQTGPQN